MKESTRQRIRAAIVDKLRADGGGARWGALVVAANTDDETVKTVRDEMVAEGLLRTRRGGEGTVRGQMWVELVREPNAIPPVTDLVPRWTPEDLDRCEHGRHSIDRCFDCPGGWSAGNGFLTHSGLASLMMDASLASLTRRIGTTVHGEPIIVRPVRGTR